MSNITISTAQPDELPEAAGLTSRAMINLPEVAVVFRGKRQRLEAAHRILYEKMPGQVFLAKDESKIVGVMRVVEWPHCKLSPKERVELLPSMEKALKSTLPRVMEFQKIWRQHDPKEHHWHLDPSLKYATEGMMNDAEKLDYWRARGVTVQRWTGGLWAYKTKKVKTPQTLAKYWSGPLEAGWKGDRGRTLATAGRLGTNDR